MDRDIVRCQKMQKVASGVVLRMDSYDWHDLGFFVENELEFLFYSLSLVVSSWSYGRVLPDARLCPTVSTTGNTTSENILN
jgi:hypothetical protein